MADEGTVQNGGTPPANTPPASEPPKPWYAGIEDPELRGTAELHKWAGPGDAVKSFRELEKLRGVPAERLLSLPEKPDDAEGWNKVYDRLGRPAKPDDYQLPVPPGFNDDFAKIAAPQLHKLGLNKQQAAGLANWWNEYQTSVITQMEQETQQRQQVELQELQREWGGAYKEREELGRRAVREFGVQADDLTVIEEALGTAKLLKLFANIGAKLGEHKYEGGSPGNQPHFGMTPDEAKARIAQLQTNKEFGKKFIDGDKAAIDEMDRLQRIAYLGGQER